MKFHFVRVNILLIYRDYFNFELLNYTFHYIYQYEFISYFLVYEINEKLLLPSNILDKIFASFVISFFFLKIYKHIYNVSVYT